MPVTLRETGARLGESVATRPSRREVTIITEGWGSSGYYSRELLERDGPTIFPIGTQMYLDHPGAAEETDRPERSVKDLAARIASTPRMVGGDLVAEAEIYEHWRPVIDALAEDIGLSIRAGGERVQGEADGRRGLIVTSLDEGISVDFVTKAGRGGKVGKLIESARKTSQVGQWRGESHDEAHDRSVSWRGPAGVHRGDDLLNETLASDISTRLNDAGKERWGGRDRYVYVDDYDPDESWAVFSICPEDGERKFVRVAFEVSGTEVQLALDTHEVRRTTAYVAATTSTVSEAAAGGQPKEAIVANEDRLAALEESVRTLTTKQTETETKLAEAEKQRDDAVTRAERAEDKIALSIAETVVREAVGKVDGLHERAVERAVKAALADKLPLAESGGLDKDKLAERAEKCAKDELAYLQEAGGAGSVTSLGERRPGGPVGEKELTEAFARLGMSETAAKTAAIGR